MRKLPAWPKMTEEGDYFYDGSHYPDYPGAEVERDLRNYHRHLDTRGRGEILMEIGDIRGELNFDDDLY